MRGRQLLSRRSIGCNGNIIQKIIEESVQGKALVQAGFGEDLVAAAAMDSFPVVAVYRDRQITRLGSESAR